MRSGQNPNIDDDTRARARRFVADADTPKPAVTAKPKLPKNRVVSKKELEESGLSLRDFLNRERGLTRRKDKPMTTSAAAKQLNLGEKPSKEAVAGAKEQLGLEDSKKENTTDYMAESAKSRGVRNMYERGAEESAKEAGMKKGGSVKGWGMARGARKAKMR